MRILSGGVFIAWDYATIEQVGHDYDVAVAVPVGDFDDGLGEHLGVGFAPGGEELNCGVEDELFGLIGSAKLFATSSGKTSSP